MDDLGVMFVVSAGNNGDNVSQHFPRNLAPHVKAMMVVGAVDKIGRPMPGNGVGASVNMLAPGVDLPKDHGPGTPGNMPLTGTSFGTFCSLSFAPCYAATPLSLSLSLLIRILMLTTL